MFNKLHDNEFLEQTGSYNNQLEILKLKSVNTENKNSIDGGFSQQV